MRRINERRSASLRAIDSRRSASLGALLALMLCGCYSPTLTGGTFACDVATDCPDSWACVKDSGSARHCYPPSGGSPDLATAPRQAVGCQNPTQGYELVAGSAYACTGGFGFSGDPSRLCGSGYSLCASGNAKHEAALPQAVVACDSLPSGAGFFGAVVRVGQLSQNGASQTYSSRCDNTENSTGYAGCGKDADTKSLSNACHSLHAAVACNGSSSWNCGKFFGNDFVAHWNVEKVGGGVMCCKD